MSNFKPIQIPPGVVTQPTKTMLSSNWAETNLMRWIEGEMQPVGGMVQYNWVDAANPTGPVITDFASRCKQIHGWFDLNQVYHIAYVCERNVYIDTGGTLTEITPTGGWAAPPMPGQGGYGDLNYSDDNYGTPRATGTVNPIDVLPNCWSVDNFGSILLVMNSVDNRLLSWDPSATANTNEVQTLSLIGAPTGGTFTLTFSGQTTGALAWNATAAAVQTALEDLPNINGANVACTGGPLPGAVTVTFVGNRGDSPQPLIGYSNNALTGGTGPQPNIARTTAGSSLVLAWVGNSPYGRCFVVTQERFVMIFGMYDDGTVDGGSERRFGWCDQENMTAWDFSNVDSQAGFLDIEPASPIVTAIAGRFGVLFFTAKKVYVSRYQGLPYVYNYIELADDCCPWSPASITTTSSYVVWMSQQGAFSFDGTSVTPVACLVRPWVTDDIDIINVREQAFAVHIGEFSEVWWFFPQSVATNPYTPHNSRCIIYNYKEGWWSQGNMSRSAGITSSYTAQPVMTDGTAAYQHELYQSYDAKTPLPWAETFDLNLTSGARLVTVKQMLPDIKGDMPNIQFAFYTRMTRSLPGALGGGVWSAPIPLSKIGDGRVPDGRGDGYVDVRVTGRGIRMRIETIGPKIDYFTVGAHLLDFAVRGDR
jgi:hypothetical protein